MTPMRFLQCVDVPLLQVAPIQQNLPAAGGVEAGEELDQGGFAGSVFPNNGEFFPRLEVEGDIL